MDRGARASVSGILLLLLLLIASAAVLALDKPDGPDGVSIDCGSEAGYVDNKNIYWQPDDAFIVTGKNAGNLTVRSGSAVVNRRQSKSLRYFDDRRERHCYVLPVEPQNTYLVRPTFYFGDWDSPSNITSFLVYLNANEWLDFRFDKETRKYFTYNYEAMVYVTDDHLDFCLVRRHGTPFISALELRRLATGMYTAVVGDHKFLGMSTRINAGANLSGPSYLRYPDDEFDRIWSTPGDWDNATHIRTKANLSTSENLTPERPPQKVMEDAWVYYDSGDLWYLSSGWNGPVGQTAIYSYFQEVDGNATDSNMREMDYFVNDVLIDSFNSSQDPYEVRTCVLTIYDNFINISVTNTSKLPPVLNAFEIYFVYDWTRSTTDDSDVASIKAIQQDYNLTDWTGDPCFPVPYAWLNCINISDSTVSIQSTNNQTRSAVTPDWTAYITGINLTNIPTLRTLPTKIAKFSYLESLNLSNTGLTSIPSTGLKVPRSLTTLDLSNNKFNGSVLEFVQNIKVKSLYQLFAANTSLEGEFPLEQLYAAFPNLEEANFDGSPKISGILNLTVWHTALNALNSGNDAAAKAAFRTLSSPAPSPDEISSSSTPPPLPLVSLRNNSISGITPSLEVLTSDINTFLRNVTESSSVDFFGLLLGGNPWCQQKDFSALPLPQQFLCRSSSDQFLPGLMSLNSSNKSDNTGAIIGGVVGGVAFLVCCVLLAAVWRFWKQTSSLREIQEALARQKVRPPFYSYSDLRAATDEFSPNNKLGQGTFGAVYKGSVLDSKDGTLELVAVKKLYPSKQALTEFLNEAVLITGLKHRNLVKLKGCCIHKEDERMLVYEYAENGNLAEALWDKSSTEKNSVTRTSSTLDWNQRLNICVGIARGLAYLHEELQPRIIHRDIKPHNILLDKNFDAKIADFGLARSIIEGQAEADFTKVAGTKGYFSPEYATQGQLTEKADVFSFGVVVLEIVSGRKCIDYHLPSEKQFLQSWARHLNDEGTAIELLDPAIEKTANVSEVIRVIKLAFFCLEFYPENRPTMSQAVAMLQGILDVTLFQPESDTTSPYRSNDLHNYVKLPLSLEDSSEIRDSSDSLKMSATSSTNTLEMTRLSGR